MVLALPGWERYLFDRRLATKRLELEKSRRQDFPALPKIPFASLSCWKRKYKDLPAGNDVDCFTGIK